MRVMWRGGKGGGSESNRQGWEVGRDLYRIQHICTVQ